MKIFEANFLRAAQDKKSYPTGGLKEIAFAGRSNVGKSSAINTLVGRHALVRTSKTPGHTRKLNFFLINDSLIFVDFPGYGFARVPREVQRQWAPMVESYLEERKELAGVVIIVDVRRLPTDADIRLITYLSLRDIPVVIAATKADKLARGALLLQKRAIQAQLGDHIPVIAFSAHTGQGKNELWKEIKSLID
ncbi:MAG: ribosome biogenesis GTP-binding protein YihA/YsxC [Desulfomonilaceae bacterium]